MLQLKKWAGIAGLLTVAVLSGCNLSQSGASGEVALNPPAVEVRPTRTPISFVNPTNTPYAAPTITVLGSGDTAAQPSSQVVDVAVVSTQPPPPNICSLEPTGNYAVNVRLGPDADFGVVTALQAGQYVPVLSRSDNGWFRVNMDTRGQGWVAAKVVTLYGPCNNLLVDVVDTAPQGIQASSPSLTPTPTGMFGFTMNIPLNHLITKTNVGSIPAGTTVMLTSSRFTGSEYLYDITTADGRYETATDSQLAYSAAGGTQPFPTPTQVIDMSTATVVGTVAPTQSALFASEIGMGVYRVATTTTVGTIPAGTAVRISSAMFNGTEWVYQIATKDGEFANANESQLAYIPNAGGGGPTPTVPVVVTVTASVMDLP